MRKTTAIGAALALALASSLVLAQPGPGYGPGMMGQGMMSGGYGQGMMGGGYGRGAGGPMAALNLSDEQQEKLFAIQEENRRKNWDKMSEVRSEAFKLRRMYNAENVDPKGLLEQQKKVDDLRRGLLASRLEMRKQMESVLTPEQRKQARQFGPWWAQEDE
jgi:Spy/CpxP family protein refolding chaperone